ncbi:MAG: O-methyltransferase [Bacteroidales bacterium]
MIKYNTLTGLLLMFMLFFSFTSLLKAQNPEADSEFDKKVRNFLNSRSWYNMNVPESDGQKLYDLIVENNYTRALEIGTSTGHSSIWIAWALSKTGGKLITIEINEERHKQALENFKEAGVSEYIDARLADAHELVPQLEGPFDFVFSDADKDWYKNYFQAVDPKLEVDGCYTSHNVSEDGGYWGSDEYLEFLKSLPHYETTVFEKGSGMSISFKKSKK